MAWHGVALCGERVRARFRNGMFMLDVCTYFRTPFSFVEVFGGGGELYEYVVWVGERELGSVFVVVLIVVTAGCYVHAACV